MLLIPIMKTISDRAPLSKNQRRIITYLLIAIAKIMEEMGSTNLVWFTVCKSLQLKTYRSRDRFKMQLLSFRVPPRRSGMVPSFQIINITLMEVSLSKVMKLLSPL